MLDSESDDSLLIRFWIQHEFADLPLCPCTTDKVTTIRFERIIGIQNHSPCHRSLCVVTKAQFDLRLPAKLAREGEATRHRLRQAGHHLLGLARKNLCTKELERLPTHRRKRVIIVHRDQVQHPPAALAHHATQIRRIRDLRSMNGEHTQRSSFTGELGLSSAEVRKPVTHQHDGVGFRRQRHVHRAQRSAAIDWQRFHGRDQFGGLTILHFERDGLVGIISECDKIHRDVAQRFKPLLQERILLLPVALPGTS